VVILYLFSLRVVIIAQILVVIAKMTPSGNQIKELMHVMII
jgi:hypothetical protein